MEDIVLFDDTKVLLELGYGLFSSGDKFRAVVMAMHRSGCLGPARMTQGLLRQVDDPPDGLSDVHTSQYLTWNWGSWIYARCFIIFQNYIFTMIKGSTAFFNTIFEFSYRSDLSVQCSHT